MTDIGRAALAARVFTIAALGSLAALTGTRFVIGPAVVALVSLAAVLAAHRRPQAQTAVATAEGAVVALAAAVAVPWEAAVTPYLVIPALIGALDRGRRGLLQVVAAEFLTLAVAWPLLGADVDRDSLAGGFTWFATALGVGAMGLALRRASTAREQDAGYRTAVDLIRRLQDLSGRLSGGLDAVDIAEQVIEEAESSVPVRHAGVFVRGREEISVPLRFSVGTGAGTMAWGGTLADKCFAARGQVLHERQAAVPLVVDRETVAVLVLDAVRFVDPKAATALQERLASHALQLQAALLFSRVRETATSQERLRIAREVHDGVAQDVASLGYLVDNLATATPEVQQQHIALLRGEVTRVVGELRHSIFDLRQVIPAGVGLGESIATYARQVGSTSAMTVHVTLDEKGGRLAGDVEHELLRIAQEAMSNARKHSGAANLWLTCTVRSPSAEIEVRDDGTRSHRPAKDSQGLTIMRERAAAIGAHLEVTAPAPDQPGTRVHVRIGAPPASLRSEAGHGDPRET